MFMIQTKISSRLYVFTFGVAALLLSLRCFMDTEYSPDIHEQSHLPPDLRYILVWTNPSHDPIMYLESGRQAFVKRNCTFTNCYTSPNRLLFDNLTEFDVIVIHGPDINIRDLPRKRSPHQKYVFASMESSHYYPICYKGFNNFFNLTWTYKLNSDVEYGYISVWNKNGEIIGPNEIMHWLDAEQMQPIDDTLKEKLKNKKYAVAWFVSNCQSRSNREKLAAKLKIELKKYDLVLDIFGNCGTKKCPRSRMKDCLQVLERDYYFYLSFENSFSEDYVTEKLLTPLQNYAVPIVYGGANYTRFMPDGMYLDATKSTPAELAANIAALIKNKEQYYGYFKWRNHYSYHEAKDSPESDANCRLCAVVNGYGRRSRLNTHLNIMSWWNAVNCSVEGHGNVPTITSKAKGNPATPLFSKRLNPRNIMSILDSLNI